MKSEINITATFDRPELLENMVEELAYKRNEDSSETLLPTGRRMIQASSTETYVSGTMEMELDNETINMPFITCFLFTCTREKNTHYKLNWALSFN